MDLAAKTVVASVSADVLLLARATRQLRFVWAGLLSIQP